jgi:AhpD family alkylhydroperoxidase
MERVDYRKFGREGFQLLGQLSELSKKSSLGHALIEFVKLRASQINHCAHCVNLHANLLRKEGESEERIQSVVVWEEATCFNAREKAAFAWTDAVTLVADTSVPDDIYEQARAQFDEQELVDLTLAITTINAHNRLAVAFRRVPGS